MWRFSPRHFVLNCRGHHQWLRMNRLEKISKMDHGLQAWKSKLNHFALILKIFLKTLWTAHKNFHVDTPLLLCTPLAAPSSFFSFCLQLASCLSRIRSSLQTCIREVSLLLFLYLAAFLVTHMEEAADFTIFE